MRGRRCTGMTQRRRLAEAAPNPARSGERRSPGSVATPFVAGVRATFEAPASRFRRGVGAMRRRNLPHQAEPIFDATSWDMLQTVPAVIEQVGPSVRARRRTQLIGAGALVLVASVALIFVGRPDLRTGVTGLRDGNGVHTALSGPAAAPHAATMAALPVDDPQPDVADPVRRRRSTCSRGPPPPPRGRPRHRCAGGGAGASRDPRQRGDGGRHIRAGCGAAGQQKPQPRDQRVVALAAPVIAEPSDTRVAAGDCRLRLLDWPAPHVKHGDAVAPGPAAAPGSDAAGDWAGGGRPQNARGVRGARQCGGG